MSYYILPKNINTINVNPISSHEPSIPCTSFSYINYYLEIKTHILDMFNNDTDLSDNNFEDAVRIINPYEFIFSKVPGSKFSVSKLKPESNIFYDLFEIFSNLNFFDNFKMCPIDTLHVSNNNNDTLYCQEIIREGFNDQNLGLKTIDIDVQLQDNKFDFIFFETNYLNEKDYFTSLINIMIIILRNQKFNGNVIIKIGDIYHKPVLDFLYFLTSLYDKVCISKPHTNNIISCDRYIICKQFQYSEQANIYLKLNYLKLIVFLKKLENKNILSFLDFQIPYYFKNKIDDLNVIIGQQQLEALDQIVSIFKNKNKQDRIDNIKKSNIQKSVSWCEKHGVPCNKFTEKINIFLPIITDTI